MKNTLTSLILSLSILSGICTAAQSAVHPPAQARATQAIQALLVDEGLYETVGPTETISAPQTAPGKTGEYGGLRLLTSTNTFVAKKGVSFGFRFLLKAPLNGRISGFEMFSSHPAMRGVDGVIHTSQTAPIEIEFENGTAQDGTVYVLSEDFEVLPGKWTLEIRYNGKALVSRTFDLQ